MSVDHSNIKKGEYEKTLDKRVFLFGKKKYLQIWKQIFI